MKETSHRLKISSNVVRSQQSMNVSFKKKNDRCKIYCPYKMLRQYAEVRVRYVSDDEPFFVYRGRSPITPIAVNKMLRKLLKASGINTERYSMHGFQVGQSLDLLKLGVSVETIKKLGRWKSNAVFNYLRWD